MTKQVQRRRGTSTQHTSFTGAEGEISVNTTNKSIHVHDGTTAGGVEAARADLANVSDTSLNNALSGNTLASLTITSADINGGTIDGTTIGGTSAAAVTTTSLVATTADINGGTVDGAVIGGSSAAAITGTTITATGDVTIADKIVHAGDTNTAIRFPAADTVTVETAGAERVRVDSSGNVGVGTASPAQELEIAGTEPNIRLNSGGTPSALYGFEITNGTTVDAYLRARGNTGETQLGSGRNAGWGGYLTFYTDTAERMRITSTGNLGIGTTSPQTRFEAFGGDARVALAAGSAATLRGYQIASGTTEFASLKAEASLGETRLTSGFSGFGGFSTFYTNGAERMRITSTGNVGIGTSSPGYRLQVYNNINGTPFAWGNAARTGFLYQDASGVGITNAAATSFDEGVYLNTADSNVALYTNATERMRITASGNVGIGTNSPFNDTGYTAIDIRGSTGGQINFGTTSTRYGQISSNATNGLVLNTVAVAPMLFFTQGNERLRIDASGNVGIGTTAPNSKLTVNGNILAPWSNSGTYEIGVEQAATNVFASTSNVFVVRGADATTSGANAMGGGSVLIRAGRSYGGAAGSAGNVTIQGGETSGGTPGSILFSTGSTATERARIDTNGNVGIGTTSPQAYTNFTVLTVDNATNGGVVSVRKNGTALLNLYTETGFGVVEGTGTGTGLKFLANNAERARIDSAGRLLIGKTAFDNNAGVLLEQNGFGYFTRSSANPIAVNRLTDDGVLIEFYQDTNLEGSISVSGTTVSYNGGHLSRWAQFPDNSRPELLKGTVMSNLDQMSNWDQEANEQLNCVQVSAVEGDANVAGVFVAWDSTDDDYNDILLAMTGDMVIRIAGGTTVQRGDLLMSAGDGTAKPQGDDIVRSKTIAKVTSTHVSHTYADGSYAVPCVLMAC
jgi:hypothetical protein